MANSLNSRCLTGSVLAAISMVTTVQAQQACPVPTDWWAGFEVVEDNAIQADADRVNLEGDNVVLLEGDVVLRDAQQELRAGTVRYQRDVERVTADGDVEYLVPNAYLRARSADVAMGSDEANLDHVRYYLRDGGRGNAEQAVFVGEDSALLTTVDFTRCDGEQPDWRLVASQIELDQQAGVGRARNLRIEFKDTPIFYLPYARFPLDDRRQSGFLYPALGTSNDDGFDIAIPYYLNLAPNYDATITPRWITDRGPMLGVEFRYLGLGGQGEFTGEYLDDDDRTNRHRAFASLQHAGQIGDRFGLYLNLNHVSDADYFEDFGDSLTSGARSLLPSSAVLSTRGEYWDFSVAADAYEIVDDTIGPNQRPYDRLPRARYRLDQPLTLNLDFELDAEAVAFERDFGTEGTRLDIYPQLAARFLGPGYYVEPRLGYRYTSYNLDNVTGDDSPSRSMPIASVEGGLIFDRPVGDGLQTLEPRFYYLYAPFEDQSALPTFDTRELTFGFSQLFRDNRFTGADRQIDANQLTLALTSRYFDGQRQERFDISLGTIVYLRDPRIGNAAGADLSTSPVVLEFNYRPSDFWRFFGGFQYDPEDDETDQAQLGLTYRRPGSTIVNLSYRHRNNLVRQVDLSALVPLNDQWKLVGRVNYSFQDDTDLETMLGLQYDSCCWALRTYVRRYVRNQEGEHRNGIYLELELKGLGSFGRRTERLLERAIAGYKGVDYQ